MKANNLSRHSTQPVVLQTAGASIASCEKLESDFRNMGDYCRNNIGSKTCEDWERMDKFLLDAADEMRKIRSCVEFLATVSSRQNLRNCDVGTAEEQCSRHDKFCDAVRNGMSGYHCEDAPKCVFCFSKWAQMPYTEGGAK